MQVAMEIKVKKMTIVKPAEDTPRRSVWLSEVDLMNNNIHIPTIHFYRPKAHSTAEFFDPEILKKALARVLVTFYPLAGRFRLDGEGRLEIDCNGEGSLFVEAESSAAMDDFEDFSPAAELRKLVPVVDFSSGISSYPLWVSQITYFKCGGVSLGVSSENRVIDGPSHFHFLNSWSDNARGLDLKIPPFLDRTILGPRDPPNPLFNHIEYQITPIKKPQIGAETSKSKVSLFKLTRDQLNTLKANIGEAKYKYSTFEIIAGHVWKCCLQSRRVSEDDETRLYFATNGRYSRLNPPLPPGFFGNAVFSSVSIASAGQIHSNPVLFAATCVHEALARADNDYLRSAIDYLKVNRGTRQFMEHNFRSPNMSITSWTGMPLYEADFGWGRPFYVGPGRVTYPEGKATIWPAASPDGSLYLAITLQHEDMKRFEKLFYAFDETKREKNSLRPNL